MQTPKGRVFKPELLILYGSYYLALFPLLSIRFDSGIKISLSQTRHELFIDRDKDVLNISSRIYLKKVWTNLQGCTIANISIEKKRIYCYYLVKTPMETDKEFELISGEYIMLY